jgi:DNA gyrase subunit A
MEVGKLRTEKAELQRSTKELSETLSSDDAIYMLMKEETKQILQKYSSPRRTEIIKNVEPITEQDLIPNLQSVILLTSNGLIKRVAMSEFDARKRGSHGVIGAGSKFSGVNASAGSDNSNSVSYSSFCHDHDTIVCVTDRFENILIVEKNFHCSPIEAQPIH